MFLFYNAQDNKVFWSFADKDVTKASAHSDDDAASPSLDHNELGKIFETRGREDSFVHPEPVSKGEKRE